MSRRREDLPEGSWLWLHDFARWLGTWIFALPFRLTVRYPQRIPRSGPVVVVANHSSFLDGPLVFALVRRRSVFLIKDEMFTGALGWVLPKIGQLSVRRGVPDRAPLTAAVRVLRAGGLVGVFPEGGRGAGDVTDARNGAAWLARTTDAVVLPIACRGTRRAPESGFRRRVDVLIGEPFAVCADRGKAGLAVATEQLREALAKLVAELDQIRADEAAGRGEKAGSGHE